MNFFISDAMAQAQGQPQGDPIMGLIFPVGLIIILYFFMIRPQVKRQKEHKRMVDALSKGDEVQLEGGVLGRITELSEQYARIEVAENVEIKVRRHAVVMVLPKGTLKEIA